MGYNNSASTRFLGDQRFDVATVDTRICRQSRTGKWYCLTGQIGVAVSLSLSAIMVLPECAGPGAAVIRFGSCSLFMSYALASVGLGSLILTWNHRTSAGVAHLVVWMDWTSHDDTGAPCIHLSIYLVFAFLSSPAHSSTLALS